MEILQFSEERIMSKSDMPFDVEIEKNGVTLYARNGFNIEHVIIPEAVRFVKLINEEKDVLLKNLRGVDLTIKIDSNVNELVEIWKQELYRTSGIEI